MNNIFEKKIIILTSDQNEENIRQNLISFMLEIFFLKIIDLKHEF